MEIKDKLVLYRMSPCHLISNAITTYVKVDGRYYSQQFTIFQKSTQSQVRSPNAACL